MVDTKVDEPTQIQDGEATVVPPRLEVAEDRRGTGEDFASLADEITVRGLDFFYGKEQALFGNTIEFKKNRVTAVSAPPAAASRPIFAPSTGSSTCIAISAPAARSCSTAPISCPRRPIFSSCAAASA
jgi:hypothetical protein